MHNDWSTALVDALVVAAFTAVATVTTAWLFLAAGVWTVIGCLQVRVALKAKYLDRADTDS